MMLLAGIDQHRDIKLKRVDASGKLPGLLLAVLPFVFRDRV